MDVANRLTTLTRIGFAARGLLYIVIALLVIGTGRTGSPSGALEYLGNGGGRVLLAVLAAGLTGYGLWRLSDAILNVERHADDRKGLAQRIGAGASGVVHLLLASQAVRLIRGADIASGSGAEWGAAAALDLPGGALVLALAGVVLLGTGAFQLLKAAKADFLNDLEPRIARQPWAKWAGRLGYAARGVIFMISGLFLLRSSLQEQASEAGGMADAISWLSSPWDLLVAIGLLGFGVFSLVQARYRRLHDVPVEELKRRAISKKPV